MYERKRRTGMEIITDILLELNKGTYKKTHLVYRVNSSWATINNYLPNLIEKGNVIETTYTTTGRGKVKRKAYKITDKGKKLLEELLHIQKTIEELI